MRDLNKYRKTIILLLAAMVATVILLTVVIWNNLLAVGGSTGISRIILLIILLAGEFLWLFFIAYTLTDKQGHEAEIDFAVQTERASMLAEYQKAKEIQSEETEKEVNIQEIVEKIVPDEKSIKGAAAYVEKLLSNLGRELNIVQGLAYLLEKEGYVVVAKYAFTSDKVHDQFKAGESLPGQVAVDRDIFVVSDIPEDYFRVESGMGSSKPFYLAFVPLIKGNNVPAILELASFASIDEFKLNILRHIMNHCGEVVSKLAKKQTI